MAEISLPASPIPGWGAGPPGIQAPSPLAAIPAAPEARIQLAHGGGGTLMQQLIDQELRRLYDPPNLVLHDAARLELPCGPLAFSTDSYVVQPLEFPGGDIGSLAVIGTANDLAMAGARPLHLSVGLILEEGLPLALLRRIVASMAAAARLCGLAIRTGDTKVVERGKADGLYVNTSGLGPIESPRPIEPQAIRPGDRILVSGDLGRHGVAILAARHRLTLDPPDGERLRAALAPGGAAARGRGGAPLPARSHPRRPGQRPRGASPGERIGAGAGGNSHSRPGAGGANLRAPGLRSPAPGQ